MCYQVPYLKKWEISKGHFENLKTCFGSGSTGVLGWELRPGTQGDLGVPCPNSSEGAPTHSHRASPAKQCQLGLGIVGLHLRASGARSASCTTKASSIIHLQIPQFHASAKTPCEFQHCLLGTRCWVWGSFIRPHLFSDQSKVY